MRGIPNLPSLSCDHRDVPGTGSPGRRWTLPDEPSIQRKDTYPHQTGTDAAACLPVQHSPTRCVYAAAAPPPPAARRQAVWGIGTPHRQVIRQHHWIPGTYSPSRGDSRVQRYRHSVTRGPSNQCESRETPWADRRIWSPSPMHPAAIFCAAARV
jgi:hypothetical protein